MASDELHLKVCVDTDGMDMKIALDPSAYLPERAHETDAGLDLRTPYRVVLWAKDSAVIDTGVHIELPHGFYGSVTSKSGLNVKHNIIAGPGTIDEGYTGSIVVKLYNLGNAYHIFEAGDKIAQLIIQPYATPKMYLVGLDEFAETERGADGFGSTGR